MQRTRASFDRRPATEPFADAVQRSEKFLWARPEAARSLAVLLAVQVAAAPTPHRHHPEAHTGLLVPRWRQAKETVSLESKSLHVLKLPLRHYHRAHTLD